MKLIVLTIAFFFTSQPAFAEPSLERITLLVTGPGCRASNEDIEKTLNGLVGVKAVDGRSVPDHFLVDIERGRVTGAELAQKIDALWEPETSCHASVMESCITAGILKVP